MKLSAKNSLKTFFRKQAVKWSLLSLGLLIIFMVPSLFWILKVGSEKHILALAQTTTLAFRPRIIPNSVGAIREAQIQMNDALKLKTPESVVIRNKEFHAIYNDGLPDIPPTCLPPKSVCWTNYLQQVEHLEPIYFDADERILLGYAHFRLRPVFDRTWLPLFLFLIPLIFAIQAWGLSSALESCATAVTDTLSQWARHIRKPAAKADIADNNTLPLFKEFEQMQEAINGLQGEVIKLQKFAVDQAKAKAQLDILSGIGHDIRNPIGQLEKYFAILVASVQRTGILHPDKIQDVERTLRRVKAVSEHVKELQVGLSSERQSCEIDEEGKILLKDMKLDSEVISRKIKLELQTDQDVISSKIAPVAFQRIFENLVRNAIEAVPHGGLITVGIKKLNSRPTLIVKDNGCGIADTDRAEIFENSFSTKASEGRGLGLGIVKNLCALYDAEIKFDSIVNQGTIFQVSFVPVGANI